MSFEMIENKAISVWRMSFGRLITDKKKGKKNCKSSKVNLLITDNTIVIHSELKF